MRVTSKGQVTIPRNIRQYLGIFPQSEVELVVDGNRLCCEQKWLKAAGEGVWLNPCGDVPQYG